MPRTSLNENVSHNARRTYRWVSLIDGSVIDQNTDNPLALRRVRFRSTVDTPGFRTMRREELPMNPFTYTETSLAQPYGVMSKTYAAPYNSEETWNGALINCDVVYAETGLGSMESSINSQALNKSLSDLKNQKVNLGVAFGERKQTGNLIMDTAKKIAGSLRALRRGDLAGVSRHLGLSERSTIRTVATARRKRQGKLTPDKALANEWLSLQYGWKPLLADVYNSAEVLAALSEDRRARVTSSKSYRWSSITHSDLWNQVPARRHEFGIYTRKYVYVFSHSNEVLKDLSAVGVTNPASVAWELLPWSFVLDWFIPVGQYIDLWDASLGLTFEKGCVTSFKKVRVRYSVNGTKQGAGITYHTNGNGSWLRVECSRSAIANFPLPHPPSFEPHITANRGASSLALLRQLLKL